MVDLKRLADIWDINFNNGWAESRSAERIHTPNTEPISNKTFTDYLFNNWRSLNKEDDILEIGIGEGNMTALLCDHVKSVIGTDISREAVHFSRKRFRNVDNVKIFKTTNLLSIGKKFDLIFAHTVMHHIPVECITDYVKQSKKILKKGGVLFFNVISNGNSDTNPFFPENQTGVFVPQCFTSSKTIEEICIQAGFKDITMIRQDVAADPNIWVYYVVCVNHEETKELKPVHNEELYIPKKVFFYYGSGKMSYLRYLCFYSFRKFHPDWEIYIYRSGKPAEKKLWPFVEHQDSLYYTGEDYTPKLKELDIKLCEYDIDHPAKDTMCEAHKADFFKWDILYKEGGVFMDTDMIFLKNIDAFIDMINNNKYNFVIHYVVPDVSYVISTVMALPKSLVCKNIYNETLNCFKPHIYQCVGASILNRWYPNGVHSITSKYKKVNAFDPGDIFFPCRWENLDYIYGENKPEIIKSDTAALHWFGGTDLGKHYNQILNEQNVYDYKNVLCREIRKVLDA